MVLPFLILLALFNGFLVVTSRVINARLGTHVSAAGASFWNHFVGSVFLALIVIFLGDVDGGRVTFTEIPLVLFLGGFIGASYVAINNFVMPKVGATKATVLVIAGQIVLGAIIDMSNGQISNLNAVILGILLVILGVWFGSFKRK
ncbi:MAG: DMT family transporter [Ardenticatenaceae bacterium]|nr:DMT family transporter [Ardenticatenaceae bacterium]